MLPFVATGRVMDLANGTYLNCSISGNSSDCTNGLYYDYQVDKTSLNYYTEV